MKFKTLIRYECGTSIVPLCIFYSIVYSIVIIGYIIAWFTQGDKYEFFVNGVEISCFIYLAILGSLGFHEDFKFLMQNGFTRKNILLSALGMFAFVSIIMATFDTLASQVLSHFTFVRYTSLFGSIYGTEHSLLIQILWLWLIYLFFACASYMFTLISHKMGKKIFYFCLITIGLLCAILVPLIVTWIIPQSLIHELSLLGLKLFGIYTNGTISFINPILVFLCFVFLTIIGSYFIVRRTELKV